jgi:putative membrane protein
MALVSDADQQRIADAITQAESKTSGEIVAVVAAESASYLYAPVLWAALVALAVPFPFIFWTWWPIQHIYLLQLLVFAALATLFTYRPIRLALVPRSVKHARAHRRAVEQFLAQNLHTMPGHTGVLIFVSVAEHYAEIIADNGIHAKVSEGTWTSIVADLTRSIGEGRAGDGFVDAIAQVGSHLAQHFPPGSRPEGGLANHLIMLSGD